MDEPSHRPPLRLVSQPPATGFIVDCNCGRRYLRGVVNEETVQLGHTVCICGLVLGAWNGKHRLVFEAEDDSTSGFQRPHLVNVPCAEPPETRALY